MQMETDSKNSKTKKNHCMHFCFLQSIPVYGSMDTAAHCLLTLRNPEGCPVLCLKHSGNFLFASLRDGTLMVYERHHRGMSYINSDVSLYCCWVDVSATLRCIWEAPGLELGKAYHSLQWESQYKGSRPKQINN